MSGSLVQGLLEIGARVTVNDVQDHSDSGLMSLLNQGDERLDRACERNGGSARARGADVERPRRTESRRNSIVRRDLIAVGRVVWMLHDTHPEKEEFKVRFGVGGKEERREGQTHNCKVL